MIFESQGVPAVAVITEPFRQTGQTMAASWGVPGYRFVEMPHPIANLTEKEIDGAETLVREQTGNRSLVLFDSGDEVTVQAGDEGIRFLLVSGKPIQEPVAWYGPIVMNTQAELQQAVSELRDGTFIKTR